MSGFTPRASAAGRHDEEPGTVPEGAFGRRDRAHRDADARARLAAAGRPAGV